MPAENINDQLKAKLDALIEVPEEFHFNPSAAWQKLEVRLQKKNNKQMRFVFKYAVAFVLLFIILSLFVYKPLSERDTIRLMVTANKKSELPRNSPFPKPENKAQSHVKNIEIKPYSKPTYNAHTGQKQKMSTNKPGISNNIVQIPIDNNLSVIEMPSDLPVAAATVIITPAKKTRFKIAHINEVNQTFIPHDIGKEIAKNNYGFSLRREVSFNNRDEKDQSVNHPVTKTKSIYSLLNLQ